MQGKTIIKIHDKGGYAIFKTRNWGERDHKSDRKKGIRRAINHKIRRKLKNESKRFIDNSLNDFVESVEKSKSIWKK